MVLVLCKKNVDGVTIFLPHTLSDDAIYNVFVPSFVKISHNVSKLLNRHYFQTDIFKWTIP